MNDQNPLPPPIPTAAAPPPLAQQCASPSEKSPGDEVPIKGLVTAAESLLREPRRVMQQLRGPRAGYLVLALLVIGLLCSSAYGFVAGTFSAGSQLWSAPAKIAGGLLAAVLICLPSLYIFSCLGGAQARLIEVTGLVAGLMALLSVLLVGFAPVAWVFSQSTASLSAMGALHLVFGLISCFFGLRFLRAGFCHYSARSRAGLNLWMVIFLLVALQMTTALRPIIGRAETFLPTEKKFFVSHWVDCLKESTPAQTTGR